MDLRKLRYITVIAQEGSINKAAQKLFITQSALCQFLKKFENSLGCSLFYRGHLGLSPTPAGIKYISKARQILDIYQDLLYDINVIADIENENIRIGMPINRSSYVLPSILDEFLCKYPNFTITLEEGNSEYLESKLIKGEIDIALLTLPINYKSINYEEISREEIVIAASKRHSIKKHSNPPSKTNRRWIDISDTGDIPYVLLMKGQRIRDFAEEQFLLNRISPPIFIYTHNPETSLRISGKGFAITFIPELFTIYHNDLEYYSIGKNGVFRTMCLAYPSTEHRPKLVIIFSEIIKNVLSNIISPQKNSV